MSLIRIAQTWRARLCVAMAALAFGMQSQPARAADSAAPAAGQRRAAHGKAPAQRRAAHPGRPRVELDRLSFPSIPNASYYKRHLRRSLRRETRRADWGAGAGAKIAYRYRVDVLRVERTPGLVRVHCAATGELPRGRRARSRLTFSGAPARERRIVEDVLGIVARGVVTRLAQMEQARRRPRAL